MNCELCGLSDKRFYKAELEGAVLNLCQTCAKYGKILEEVEDSVHGQSAKQGIFVSGMVLEKQLKPNFAAIINSKILEEKLNIDELASRIKISPYDLKKIIAGKLIPPDIVAEKLEKALNISLFETLSTSFKGKKDDKQQLFEDIVQIKRKK